MVWLHKIPPMMSALALGYGVGMAAPDSTIQDAQAAFDAYGARQAPVSHPHQIAGHGPTGHPAYPYPYPYAYPHPHAHPGAHPHPGAHAAPGPAAAAYGQRGSHAHLAGTESGALARLRQGAPAGHSCELHRPNASQPPSYASRASDDYFDAAELSPAGQDALSRLQLPDFNVAVSRSALKYVRFLTRSHRGRDLFTSWLKRSGRYSEMVQQELRERKLPEDLIWVAMIESGFDPVAKSPVGATGMWQFMRSTGEVYGLEVNRFHDLRKNPIVATRAATHHLRDLYQRFGSWDLAFAAYNMGYEQLLDRIDRYGTTDFNELARQRALPSETAAYVPKIVAAALVANNLDRYGFEDVKVYNPIHSSELSVPGGTPLKTLAKAAGVSTGTIRKLNPHLRTKFLPPGADYVVYVPPTSLSRARAALPAMMDNRQAWNDTNVLLPNDLAGLSGPKSKNLRHNTWTEDENLLRFLPKPKRRSLRKVASGKPLAQKRDDDLGAVAEEFAPRRGDRETVMYRVGPGDTLIGVAKQFAIDIDDLARDNSLDPDDMLREGAILKLLVKRNVLDRWKKKAGQRDKVMGKRSTRSKRNKSKG